MENGIHFGFGSTLAFSRRALEAIGGLQVLSDYLADDYELGHRIAQTGFRVELGGCIVDHHIPEYSFPAFLQHQLRWARAIRTSRPGGYAGMIFTFALPWTGLAVLLMPGTTMTWLLFALAVLLRYAVWFATEARVLTARPRFQDAWLLPIRDVIALVVWIACYTGRRIVWRGRRFELVNGKLRHLNG